MNANISFLPPVNSIAELKGVFPKTPIAYACDVSDPTKHAFFVFTNGAWLQESVEIVEQEIYVRLGDQVTLMKADGTQSNAVLTYISGRVIMHEIHGEH